MPELLFNRVELKDVDFPFYVKSTNDRGIVDVIVEYHPRFKRVFTIQDYTIGIRTTQTCETPRVFGPMDSLCSYTDLCDFVDTMCTMIEHTL